MTSSEFDSFRPPEPPRRRGRGFGRGGKRRPGRGFGQGDGNREMSMVPDAEFTSYYGHPVVKPPPWDEKVAAYLFLGGVAGGSGVLAAGAQLTGRDALRRNARLGGLGAVGLGGIALVADLARQLKTPVIASGLAKTLDHVSTLKYLGNIAGAIVGRGLHHGTFTLEEAQRIVVERDTRAMMLRRLSEGAPVKTSGITIHQGPPSEKGTSRPRGARFAKVAESHS